VGYWPFLWNIEVFNDTFPRRVESFPVTQPQEIEVLARAEASFSALMPIIQPLAAEFNTRGHHLYLVGGSVRDALLGRLGNDVDFTTDARPETILEILEHFADITWDTGIEYGTVSAEKSGQQIEITTFRSDIYDGESRNPEVVFGDTLAGDLVRRDFTINAMAVEITSAPDAAGATPAAAELEFFDPMGGFADLMKGVIDTPAAPDQSFADDPLRLLRAARFSSQLGFAVSDRVRVAMTDLASEIQRITVERVQVELDKMLLGAQPWLGIDLMVTTGLADYVFPELPRLQLAQDEHHQHKDVYAHSLQVLRQAMDQEAAGEPDLVLRWAALVHDIGKPDTREFTEDGRVSFHQHEVVGAKLVRNRMRKLKYSKAMVRDVSQLVYLHMRFHGFSEGQWTDSAVRRYVTDAGDLLPRLHKLVRADCTTRNKRKAAWLRQMYAQLEERIADLAAKEDLAKVRPDLDGKEIMAILGLQPGPDVGKAWSYLKEVRLERGPLDRDEAIKVLTTWWADRQGQQEQQDQQIHQVQQDER